MAHKMVFLTGPRACGKTTVGMRLAARLAEWRFFDLDQEYHNKNYGRTDSNEEEDPREYYRRSAQLLRAHLGAERLVVALGGGTLINPVESTAASDLLLEIKQRGPLILILPSRFNWRSKRILFERERNRNYAAITGEDTLRRVSATHFDERIDFFRANADLTVYGQTPEELARRIIRSLLLF